MEEVYTASEIKRLLNPLLEKGFSFEYFYEKGGDSSCSYVCRFKKGRDFFDWREVSGGEEISFVVYANGNYDFPNLKTLYKKEYTRFQVKHFLKKASVLARREFMAQLLLRELEKPSFFGIIL